MIVLSLKNKVLLEIKCQMIYSDCTNTRVSNCTERQNLIMSSFTNDHKEFPYTIVMKVHGIRKLVQEQHQTKQGEYSRYK